MYLLKEQSASTDEPYFLTLPKTSENPKQQQYLFFPERSVAKWFYESGIAEKNLIHWVLDTFIDPNKNFLDIGAHVGTYTWTLGKKANHTYAFECSPKTFCYLAANIALQNLTEKVSVFPFALGSQEGTLDYIVRSEDGGGNGVKRLSENDETCKKIPVMVKTLDSFHLENIGFIKIDVEGFEKDVLMGSVETLKKNHWPKILFECWGDWKEREGVHAKQIRMELFTFLESLGYGIKQIHGIQDMYLAEKQ